MSSMKHVSLILAVAIVACESERPRDRGNPRPPSSPTADTGVSMADADTTDASSDDAGAGMDTGAIDTGGGGNIPVPPMTVAGDWPDTEPNDTPETAVPVGQFQFALWMGFGGQPNRIATNTDVDFYVFRTGDAASLMGTLGMSVCANESINLFDAYVYNVTGGALGSMVKAAASATPGCENIFSGAELQAALQPNSIYVLELRAAPGLELGANTGMYSA